MGYTTEFRGSFQLDKPLQPKILAFLTMFNETRRMKRNQDPVFGIDGEFFVFGTGSYGQDHSSDIVDYNKEPSTQPSLWCQWVPNEDGTAIEWDGGEKFYCYGDWLIYLIEKILKPNGYVLNGSVDWRGESFDDNGTLTVIDNVVSGINTLKLNMRTDVVLILNEDGKSLQEETLLLPETTSDADEKNYNIKIMGEGSNEEIASKLEAIAAKIRSTDHVVGVSTHGEVEWEDDVLFTSIKEA